MKMNRFHQLPLFVTLLSATAWVGCAEDIQPEPSDPCPPEVTVITTDSTGTTRVGACSQENWLYLDLDANTQVFPENSAADPTWDLAFQRFKILTNGGVTGTGAVAVARVASGDYDAMTEAPTQRYVEDVEDSDDDGDEADNPFNEATSWYDYDREDHTLSPADFVYVIRSTEGAYFKLEMTNYYDEAGTSGFPAFRFAAIDPPSGDPALADRLVVDASSNEEWVYINTFDRTVVEIEDPTDSEDWDLAIRRTQIQTNSGTSGAGHGGAKIAAETQWENLTSTPTIGFAVDRELSAPGRPNAPGFSGHPDLNEWYDYNGQTHAVTPKDQMYVLRTGEGDYTKLQILDYADGVLTLRLDSLTRDLQTYTETVNPLDDGGFVYFDMDHGLAMTPDDPSSNLEWDLAVSRTKIQTNSGTSGSGQGGAYNPETGSLEEVSRVPAGEGCYLPLGGHVCDCALTVDQCAEQSGIMTGQCGCPAPFTVDEMLPAPGPSGESYSGSPILAEWYNYDPNTHVVSPKDASYLVRTSDGAFSKIKITEYEDGALTFQWSFAGPGQTRF